MATDNSYLKYKIDIRINNLPSKTDIKVLDCFAGEGVIWDTIKNKLKHINFDIISIDKHYRDNVDLVGNNIKFLKNLDLSCYDVIDLDAYGVPYKQLKIVFTNKSLSINTIFFVTFIASNRGMLPYGLLIEYGYNYNMIKKIPTLLCKQPIKKLFHFLAKNNVKKVKYYYKNRKYYMFFRREL